MKLPNGERSIVDIRKLREYCLNSQHPRGRHKARVFASVGIREADAEELGTALLAAASNAEARLGAANPHGQRYVVDFDCRDPVAIASAFTFLFRWRLWHTRNSRKKLF